MVQGCFLGCAALEDAPTERSPRMSEMINDVHRRALLKGAFGAGAGLALAGFVLLSSFVQTNAADWQTYTEHQFEISSPAQLETPLTNEFGSLDIDMTGLELDRDRTYTVKNEVGEVRVTVPAGLSVDANCTTEIGSVDCPELSTNDDGPVLTLDISNEIGSVKVTR